jgi:hypothetical protein
MLVLTFCKNALLPSSGWLNLVQVDDDMTARRKCADYTGKLEDSGLSELLTTLLFHVVYEPKRPSLQQHCVKT